MKKDRKNTNLRYMELKQLMTAEENQTGIKPKKHEYYMDFGNPSVIIVYSEN